MKIYVASSWRNAHQPHVVETLRRAGHEVYDFKNPAPGDTGFHWYECHVDVRVSDTAVDRYRRRLASQRAQDAFAHDFGAMKWADACVLVLPSGRSAHIEAGWFTGNGRKLVVYIPEGEPVDYELMYLLGGDCVRDSMVDVLEALAEPAAKCWCSSCDGMRVHNDACPLHGTPEGRAALAAAEPAAEHGAKRTLDARADLFDTVNDEDREPGDLKKAVDAFEAAVLDADGARELVERLRTEWVYASTEVGGGRDDDGAPTDPFNGSMCAMCGRDGEDGKPETIDHDSGCLVAAADAWLSAR